MSIRVKTETVEIDSVKQLPNNPRRGNVPKIAESLGLLGQYRPIVVRREDNTILAGNHTWLAAKALKRKKIAVTWISCDDETARKIILADNRTSDLASYDNEALRDELRSLPDLEGTGYTQLDIDRLDGLFTDSSSRPTDENEPAAKSDDYWLEVGEFVGQLDRDTYLAWNSALVDVTGNKPASARKEVRTRLKIPMDAKPKVKEIGELISGQGEISIQEGSIEEIGTLIPYPHNVREGDVGAISVVLSEIGQYRPIVVNKLTREILVGNHTWFAASMLKWKEIAVVFVDVDEVIAKKIVLADNRTSDLCVALGLIEMI
jgi:ParB-like chromosome segregation protein Spo0J